LIIFISPNKHW